MSVDSTTFLPQMDWDPPQVSPAPSGLFAAVSWTEQGNGPLRWLGDGGLQVRTINYGFEANVRTWTEEPFELSPSQSKNYADRPEYLPPFLGTTVFASDGCGLRNVNQVEARRNASAWLARQAPVQVAETFAGRLLDDAGTPSTAASILSAIGALESSLAQSNSLGFIHLNPLWAVALARYQLIIRSGSTLRSPLGHTYVFDGGYVNGLGDTLVATSQVYGWRGSEQDKESWDHRTNQFIAVAEQSFLLSYEDVIDSVSIAGNVETTPGPATYPSTQTFP